MTANRTLIAGAFAILALAGCSKEAEAPDGQVVATIDGKDVTIHEVNAEMGLLRAAPNAPRKLLEQVALARVLERKMLAMEARNSKLDTRPEFLLSRTRAVEGLLVQSLQAEIAGKEPQPTREAAQKFISDNPQVFSERKIFSLDQIQFLRPDNLEKLPLASAKTMEDVERILIDANIEYRRAPQQLDSLVINPQLTGEIMKLSNPATREPFMFIDQPANAIGQVVFVNDITEIKSQPFTGERAITYAEAVLRQQAVQKRLAAELDKWNEAYKPKIVYAKNYGPPDTSLMNAPAKPGAAAKPAEPAAPAPAPVNIDAAAAAVTS